MFLPVDPSLDSLLARLESLSSEPEFQYSRHLALKRALAAYAPETQRTPLEPLAEEVELAKLYLYADYRPDIGSPPIIDWIRDDVTRHLPGEERAWLDPLKRSWMDMVEVETVDGSDDASPVWTVGLRSLGDGRRYVLADVPLDQPAQKRDVFLTRLLQTPARMSDDQEPTQIVPVGPLILLANRHGRAVYESTDQWRRELEAQSGSFSLGDWQTFAKQFGYVLLWCHAQTRMEVLLKTETDMRYETPEGRRVLFALALYEHREFRYLADVIGTLRGWRQESESPAGATPCHTWIQQEPDGPSGEVRARLTLTPNELQVECDSARRLDDIKHQLAASCGYSLHLRGEASDPPAHKPPKVELSQEPGSPPTAVVSEEEERRLLKAFVESLYWDWPDHPCAALGGQTPRHAASSPASRVKVASLIDQLEQTDLVYRRVGQAGYDFCQLRRKVGLEVEGNRR